MFMHLFLFLLVVLNAVFTAASCTLLHQRVNKTFANEGEPKSWHTEMRRGFSVMVSSRWLLHAVLASFLTSVANVVWIAAITYLFVEQVLMVSEGWWGFLNASLLIGLLLASLVLRTHHSLIQQNQSKTVFVGLVGTALFTLLFALTVELFCASYHCLSRVLFTARGRRFTDAVSRANRRKRSSLRLCCRRYCCHVRVCTRLLARWLCCGPFAFNVDLLDFSTTHRFG